MRLSLELISKHANTGVTESLENEVAIIYDVLEHNFASTLTEVQLEALTSLVHDIGLEVFLDSILPTAIINTRWDIVKSKIFAFTRMNRVASLSSCKRRQEELSLLTGVVK